jgi:hypothetical protein
LREFRREHATTRIHVRPVPIPPCVSFDILHRLDPHELDPRRGDEDREGHPTTREPIVEKLGRGQLKRASGREDDPRSLHPERPLEFHGETTDLGGRDARHLP